MCQIWSHAHQPCDQECCTHTSVSRKHLPGHQWRVAIAGGWLIFQKYSPSLVSAKAETKRKKIKKKNLFFFFQKNVRLDELILVSLAQMGEWPLILMWNTACNSHTDNNDTFQLHRMHFLMGQISQNTVTCGTWPAFPLALTSNKRMSLWASQY